MKENLPIKAPALDLPPEYVERLILKKFLSDPEYASFISENSDSSYFEVPAIKEAMTLGSSYYKRYSALPSTELLTKLMEASGKVEESRMMESYLNVSVSHDETFIKDSIKGYLQAKAFFYLIFSNASNILKERTVAPYIKELQRISSIDFYSDLGFNYLDQIEEHIFDLTNPEARLATGFDDFDAKTNGGIPKDGKCLIVLMAQPGLGKSLTMHNLAANWLMNDKKVLIISLEMTEKIYSRRISANLADQDIDQLQSTLSVEAIRKKAKEIKENHPNSGLIIKEFPPSTIRSVNIQHYVEQLILSGFKPDVVIVDYLNLVLPNAANGNSNSYERIGDVAKELRALSYKFGIPFITATQSNRSGFNNVDIGMDNISESAATAHHCDFLGAIYQEPGDIENCIINLVLLKNRFGGCVGHRIKFLIDYHTLRLRNFRNATISNPEVDELIESIGNE